MRQIVHYFKRMFATKISIQPPRPGLCEYSKLTFMLPKVAITTSVTMNCYKGRVDILVKTWCLVCSFSLERMSTFSCADKYSKTVVENKQVNWLLKYIVGESLPFNKIK